MALEHGIDDQSGESPAGVTVGGPKQVIEYEADGAITPGALVSRGTSAGQVTEAAAGDDQVIGYAMENQQEGVTDLQADYSDGDSVPINVAPGALWYAIAQDTTGADTHQTGDVLRAEASGEVGAFTATTDTATNDSPEDAVARYVGKDDITNNGSTSRILARLGA